MNQDIGLGHAFAYVYEYMLYGVDIPMVPVMINTFFPPNQPTPARCYGLGRSLRQAIDSWDSDKRVAVIASGGLSHTIMDEEIDRMTLDGVLEKDGEALCNLPRERLNLGTSEIRNWITVAGALEDMNVQQIGDYIPAYRSRLAPAAASPSRTGTSHGDDEGPRHLWRDQRTQNLLDR